MQLNTIMRMQLKPLPQEPTSLLHEAFKHFKEAIGSEKCHFGVFKFWPEPLSLTSSLQLTRFPGPARFPERMTCPSQLKSNILPKRHKGRKQHWF